MADDPTKPPEVPTPPAPPVAAGDKPASASPTEPLKAEVSRTDSPGAGVSAAPPKPAAPDAPQPANPAAATTATTAAASSVTAAPAKPAAAAPAKPAAPAAARPAAAGAAKPAAAEHPPKAAAPTGPSDPPPPADLPVPAFITALRTALPSAVTGLSYFVGDWTVLVSAAQILDVARFLRSSPEALFDLCSDLTASDWPPRPERFDVVYCLFSTRHRHRVRVKAKVADNQPIASVTSVWPAAGWLEREVFDMFGVQFSGHSDLRRILMPEDWQGYPQRKDYPLEGPGELLMENPLDWLKLRQAKEEAEIE